MKKQAMINNCGEVFFVALCLMLLISFFAVFVVEQYKSAISYRKMEYLALTKSNKIRESVIGLLYKTEALSALVIQGQGKIHDFKKVAAIIINDPAVKNILIAPGGVVWDVYPDESNHEVVGYNLLGPGDGNEEARISLKTNRLTMGGPFNTVQGGQAIVGRLPVYMGDDGDKKFWGLVSVTLKYPEALEAVNLEDIQNMGFDCEVWRVNPDNKGKQIILRSAEKALENPVEKTFDILNAKWRISIAPSVRWYQDMSFFISVMCAIFISVLVAMLAQSYYETKKMKGIMEKLAMFDELTGLPNRRYFFDRLEQEISFSAITGKPLVVGYMDLDGFKNINDSHGHKAGDLVLVEVSNRIRKYVTRDGIAARIGGDEFVIMVVDARDTEWVMKMFKELTDCINQPMELGGESLNISASIGTATFPEDGENAEQITAHADACMYTAKRRLRTATNQV